MNCVAIIFVAFLAINSGPSLALSGNSNSHSRKTYTAEELSNCHMNSTISVKILRNLKGEWLTNFEALKKLPDFTRSMDLNLDKNLIECGDSRYIKISDFLKDTEDENSSEATVGDRRNNTDGEAYDSCKRCTKKFDATVKGRKIELSNGFRTATRTRPTESSYYGTVVSNSRLDEDEVFEIMIDETGVDEARFWGIGFGVVEDKDERIKDVSYLFNNMDIKGTWSIYSRSDINTGKCNTYIDGHIITTNEYPLPTHNLTVGTLLGVSRRRNGNLHYYLNGIDKGAAFVNVTKDVYAFVDVKSYVTKISIMD